MAFMAMLRWHRSTLVELLATEEVGISPPSHMETSRSPLNGRLLDTPAKELLDSASVFQREIAN